MKNFTVFSILIVLNFLVSSCTNDHEDFGPMKGINYFSRNDALSLEQISFDNEVGIIADTLKKLSVLSIAPGSFTNKDGSTFNGKVILTVKENLVRGYMALNCIPTVTADGKPLFSEGAVYVNAVDINGHELKIADNKFISLSIPGGSSINGNKMYYAEDNVKDPSPSNTSLFNWTEVSADTVESYFDNNTSAYYYNLKPTQLGWVSCAHEISVSNPAGINVRVWGVSAFSSNNTAVYVVPVIGQSAFRLWNYDANTHAFSLDNTYLNNGSEVFVIVIASVRHFKIYWAKEKFTVGSSNQVTVNAVETSLNSIATNLYYL